MRNLRGWVILVAVVVVPAAARAQAPPSFNLAPVYSGVAGSLTASVAVGDFNQDGIPDLALGSSDYGAPGNSISLLFGTGGGVYAPAVPLPFPAGSASLFLVCADLNGDGLLDLVSTDYLNNLIQVLMATGPGTFAAPVSYAVDVTPKGIAVADFNGDGFLDLAVAAGNYSAGRVSVLLGTGTGTFLAAVSYAVGRTPSGIVAADFNGDGIMDLAACNFGSFNVSILLGTGTGTFGTAVNYAAGGTNDNPIRMVAADFNGDGFMDLAVTTNKISPSSGKVQILLGAGNGTFLPRVTYDAGNGSNPRGLAVGDFNGDGIRDLAVVAQGYNSVEVFLGTGTGTFALAPVACGVGNGSYYAQIADLNGDGIPDMAVTGSAGVSIVLGKGAGKFAAPESYAAGTDPSSVAMGDFNGDGLADLAVANAGSNNVSVRLGTGAGAFGLAASYSAGSGPASVVTADFNGDSFLDLAVANFASNDVSILLGNGDGTFGPPASYSAGLGPVSLAVGDFNGDGRLDLAAADYNAPTDISVTILLGAGLGAFAPGGSYQAGFDPDGVAVADFNGDGHLDLAVANFYGATVSILLGTGTGSFGAPTNYGVAGYASSVAAGDFSGDGLTDLAVTCFSGPAPGVVSVLLGAGGGSFAPAVPYDAGGPWPTSAAVADFNGDGLLDLLVANSLASTSVNSVSVLPGTGAGAFGAPVMFTVGSTPSGAAAGDLNGDALPDLAVADSDAYDVRILLNTTPATADLSITVSDGGVTPLWGGSLSYSITVTNSGPGAVTGATVSDSFPAGLAGVAWTCAASPGSACTAAGSGNLSDAAVALLPGGTVTYSAIGVVVYGTAGPLVNTATVGSSAYDPVPANNSSTVSTPVDGDLIFKDGFESAPGPQPGEPRLRPLAEARRGERPSSRAISRRSVLALR